ncbi:MAG: tetratricopeptide repeat protein [Ferruginibacter sp.]|nr:tetratricopeptide repeat protein [Chitinophagaceae bacterium]MBP6286478.1 tetratricopeptide repeat protein [Ferruginibacter sp.]
MKKLKFTLILLSSLMTVGLVNAQGIEEGKRFLYYEKFISAKNVFQGLLGANPANEEAAYWLGQTLLAPDEDKDLAGARAVYAKALAANPNSALLNAGMGHVELLEGKTQEARNHFETAISLSKGKSIEVLDAVGFANGDFDSKLGDGAYAVEKLQQATSIKGFKDARILTDLGDAYRKVGDGGSAQRTYEAALAIDPRYARAKYRIGRIYQSQGETQKDIFLGYYNEAIALDPAYTRVYFTLHQYYYETDVVKSAEYLNKYLASKGSDETNACFLQAQMKYAQGLFAETVTAANSCIASTPNPYPNLYGLVAYSSYKLGDSLGAKNAFEQYFQKQKPDKIGVRDRFTYGEVLLKFPGSEALAGTYIQQAVDQDSTEAGKVALLKSVASTYEKRGQYTEAGDWYKKVLNIKKTPTKNEIYNAGYSYYRIGKFAQASEVFDIYTQKYPDDIFGYYMMGKCYWGIDTTMVFGLANNAFAKAIQVGEAYPDKSKILAQLMGSYKYMIAYGANIEKNKELALSFADKALLVDATDQEVLTNKDIISKITFKPNTKPANKADKVIMGADGSITATGSDGSSTVITKEGKITTIKDGITTIIENGKVTMIGKDGKVINPTPPAPPAKPAKPKPGSGTAPKKK